MQNAQLALNAATAAGFRESGISSLIDSRGHPTPPMVAVRSSGQATDTIVGVLPNDSDDVVPMVSEDYLRAYLGIANERFRENEQRKARFREAFLRLTAARDNETSPIARPSHLQQAAGVPPLSDKQRRKQERKAETARSWNEVRNWQYDIVVCSSPAVEETPEDDLRFLLGEDTTES